MRPRKATCIIWDLELSGEVCPLGIPWTGSFTALSLSFFVRVEILISPRHRVFVMCGWYVKMLCKLSHITLMLLSLLLGPSEDAIISDSCRKGQQPPRGWGSAGQSEDPSIPRVMKMMKTLQQEQVLTDPPHSSSPLPAPPLCATYWPLTPPPPVLALPVAPHLFYLWVFRKCFITAPSVNAVIDER